MSTPPLEPIDPELASLLDVERTATAPMDALDRAWTRVARGILPAGPGGGAAGGGTGAGGGSWLSSHAALAAAGAFVLGGAAGAGLYAAVQRSPPDRVVYVDRPAPPPIAIPLSTPLPSTPPAASRPPDTATAAQASPRPALAPASSSLSLERNVLDDARAALASGDAARALRLSDEHLRRFPTPQLAEEREAIAIQSLAVLGRSGEARARAARFRASAPHSLFLPAIDATLGSIP